MSGTLSGTPPVFSKTITGYRAVSTWSGDNPERIAQRELGDASRWYDIIELNGLAPPWITDDPALASATVRLAGRDSVLVPSTAPQTTGVAASPDIFGIDCLLNRGQLDVTSGGDILTISGPDNLRQALENRLGCRPAELIYHPEYGNRAWLLLGQGNTPIHGQLAASWSSAACKMDPRVSSTEQFSGSTLGDVLAVSGNAVAVNGKRLPVGVQKTPYVSKPVLGTPAAKPPSIITHTTTATPPPPPPPPIQPDFSVADFSSFDFLTPG